MNIEKLESISKIIAAVFIPLAIAFMGNELSIINKKKDTETKLVELATTILTKEVDRKSTESQQLRQWAVDVINTYSGVKMSEETRTALVTRISLPHNRTGADDSASTFAVVFGADKTVDAAKHEVTVTARQAGVKGAEIFLRSGAYRSVIVAESRADAEELLGRLQGQRASSYIVDMTKWCPNTVRNHEYFECRF